LHYRSSQGERYRRVPYITQVLTQNLPLHAKMIYRMTEEEAGYHVLVYEANRLSINSGY